MNIYSTNKTRKKESVHQQEKTAILLKLRTILTPINLLIISLILVASVILVWDVAYVIWNDITIWKKDLNLIFFGTRAGEGISMGIGLKIIHYYLIGISLLFMSIILLFLNRWKNKTRYNKINTSS